jgi:hypothetical protein
MDVEPFEGISPRALPFVAIASQFDHRRRSIEGVVVDSNPSVSQAGHQGGAVEAIPNSSRPIPSRLLERQWPPRFLPAPTTVLAHRRHRSLVHQRRLTVRPENVELGTAVARSAHRCMHRDQTSDAKSRTQVRRGRRGVAPRRVIAKLRGPSAITRDVEVPSRRLAEWIKDIEALRERQFTGSHAHLGRQPGPDLVDEHGQRRPKERHDPTGRTGAPSKRSTENFHICRTLHRRAHDFPSWWNRTLGPGPERAASAGPRRSPTASQSWPGGGPAPSARGSPSGPFPPTGGATEGRSCKSC